jgi:hypothetical protein
MVEPSAFPPFTRTAVSERAADLLPKYRAAIADIPPEAGFGGIWESEMFLFYAAVRPCAPKQILEPGRARGKSTLILACCFPNARIISVEFESHSPNATVAEAKLKPCQNLEGQNVEVWYGDSRKILPSVLSWRRRLEETAAAPESMSIFGKSQTGNRNQIRVVWQFELGLFANGRWNYRNQFIICRRDLPE